MSSVDDARASEAWRAVNPLLAGGRDAAAEMIESSLMRPRFLIDICERAISFAINRGHEAVLREDVQDAMEQHSLYLVSDFGYEIRDVSGVSEDIFYAFLGKGTILTEDEVVTILSSVDATFDIRGLSP